MVKGSELIWARLGPTGSCGIDGVEGVEGDEEPEHPLRTMPNSKTAAVSKDLGFGTAINALQGARSPADQNAEDSDNKGIEP